MKNFSLKTKESSHHSSRNPHTKRFIFIVVGACILLFSAKTYLGSITQFFISPLLYVRHYVETSSATIPVFVRSRLELDAKINELESELRKRNALYVNAEQLEAENAKLRNLLQASSSPRILAGVIGRPPRTPYDTIILDRGRNDGIVNGAPLFVDDRIVIGYVHTVYEHTAFATLLSTPGMETTVYIFGPNIFATAYGEGNNTLRISVPQGITITQDDLVITPSVFGGVLGRVSYIQSIPTEPEQHAYVTSDVSLQSLRLVAVGSEPLQVRTFEEATHAVEKLRSDLFTVNVPESARVDATQGSTTTTVSESQEASTSTPPL